MVRLLGLSNKRTQSPIYSPMSDSVGCVCRNSYRSAAGSRTDCNHCQINTERV
ncbi:hypothetical protein HanIR_Chr09g0411091 [Helianthus annuus]|nr:hypothetical protein HanIR_Chr09g0411091 [Helianthus annuus]